MTDHSSQAGIMRAKRHNENDKAHGPAWPMRLEEVILEGNLERAADLL
jgi:hypothetical protein